MELSKGGSLFGGSLLVAGTTIGGGILALPLLTAAGGFIPATVIFFLCWLFMTATGLLLVEVFLWNKEEVNLVSMAKMTLGLPGKVFAWLIYLFFFYSVTVAYVSAGGGLVADLFDALGSQSLHPWIGPTLFVVCFAPFVVAGAKAVDRVNVFLMAGLILSFLFFVALGFSHIQPSQLVERVNFPAGFLVLPVAFASFGYQGMVPTLTNYLDRDPVRVRKAILIGTTLPFVTYLIWEALFLGVVPFEELEKARLLGQTAIAPLKNILEFPWLFRVGEFFAFFTIVTSFLGVTIGLLDFLADGLQIKKDRKGRIFLALLIYLPPLLFTFYNPCLFLNALHYAGGIGSALLLGLLPILMAWRGRYTLGYKGVSLIKGGKGILVLLLAFIALELYVVVSRLIV